MDPHPRLDALADALGARAPAPDRPDPGLAAAAVALLLRPAPLDVELLLIRRAERQGDPWSGHVALPGGREQPEDAHPAATAARETHEEVRIDVGHGRLLGPLAPVWPRSERAPRILVRPFVYRVPAGTEARGNHEVDAAFWVPLGELEEPGAVREHLLEIEGMEPMRFPAFDARGHVVWGLTHRILTDFLRLWKSLAM